MQLTKEEINEFKDIYKAEFSVELSDEEAAEAAHQVLGLVKLLIKE